MFRRNIYKRVIEKISGLAGLGLLIILVLPSCDILDKEPLDAVPIEEMWNNEVLATAFLNDIYYYAMPEFSATRTSAYSDETGGGRGFMYGLFDISRTEFAESSLMDHVFGRDTYAIIRKINHFLLNLEEGNLDFEVKRKLKGQALFLRAWVYQQLVILYGGVPMILELQEPFLEGDVNEELFVRRNSTKECVEFICADLDSAFTLLPSEWEDSEDYGRITRGAAIALKGRLLLYWASPQFNPGNDPLRWQWAYDVNKLAIDSLTADGYGLYSSFEDLLNNCAEKTNEAIMITRYSATNISFTHSYDNNVRPNLESRSGRGTSNNPTWNFVKAFPMKDGYPIYAATETYPYDSIMYWLNRDPRFNFTVASNTQSWPLSDNSEYKVWSYFYKNDKGAYLNAINNTSSNYSTTGFYCKKFINPSINSDETDQVGTDWIEIRFAEVLLNFAECANELDGKESEVRDALNRIRNERTDVKVGMGYIDANLNNKDIMREIVLTERQIELAFENKRHWDLRRRNMFTNDLGPNIKKLNGTFRYGWRIELNQIRFPDYNEFVLQRDAGVFPFNTALYYKQTFNVNYADTLDTEYAISFLQPDYNFYPLPLDDISKNPNLEQTIYWGGNFDPFDE